MFVSKIRAAETNEETASYAMTRQLVPYVAWCELLLERLSWPEIPVVTPLPPQGVRSGTGRLVGRYRLCCAGTALGWSMLASHCPIPALALLVDLVDFRWQEFPGSSPAQLADTRRGQHRTQP